jgi:DNA-binding transcriptional regulator YiaG
MNIQHFVRHGEAMCATPLHYMECGLDNIYLKNGFFQEEIDGEVFTTIQNIDGLHQAIGRHIVLARKAPSGKELRFLRNELAMSQTELAKVLGISDQSVARWEKGQYEANGAAVFALRMIYLLSLVPKEEKLKILESILDTLKKLSEMDETNDDIFLTYSAHRWQDLDLRAA